MHALLRYLRNHEEVQYNIIIIIISIKELLSSFRSWSSYYDNIYIYMWYAVLVSWFWTLPAPRVILLQFFSALSISWASATAQWYLFHQMFSALVTNCKITRLITNFLLWLELLVIILLFLINSDWCLDITTIAMLPTHLTGCTHDHVAFEMHFLQCIVGVGWKCMGFHMG